MRIRLLALIGVSIIIGFSYWRLSEAEFIGYDDAAYIIENPYIQNGLTIDGVAWAFTAVRESNWHPLTWLSHMLDVSLFGLDAGGHHIVNVLIHITNTILLSLALTALTGEFWKGLIVAALFGLHPLHVESVAWVSERKDMLSGLFFMLILLSYASYVKGPSRLRYSIVALFFALGLMAKPMLVTVPFLLLLLDFWPLRRLDLMHGKDTAVRTTANLVREKVPLLFMTVISSIVTFIAQSRGGAVVGYDESSFIMNLMNAVISYARYIYLTFLPLKLGVFYPFPKDIPFHLFGLSLAIVAGITFFSIKKAKAAPYLTVGWFWFLGMMVPVIGIIRVGAQAMADRYTYLPLIGIFIALVWGVSALFDRYSVSMRVRGLIVAALLIVSGLITYRQVGFWHDAVSLFSHTAEVTGDNSVAFENLGSAYAKRGEFDRAVKFLKEAVRVNPDYHVAHNNLGNVLGQLGRYDEAVGAYLRAVQLKPDYVMAHYNLGLIYMSVYGDIARAIEEYRILVGLDSKRAESLLRIIEQMEKMRHGDHK